MSELKISVPDDALVALRIEPEALGAELRMAAAVKMYELGRMSSGTAARLAGVPRAVFISRLADYDVPAFRLTEAQLEADAERA